MKYGIRKEIEANIGITSLVGIGNSEFPKSFGNYFSFWTTREDSISGSDIRCVNMWSENLKEARKRFFKDGLVQGVLFSEELDNGLIKRWFVVDDPRLSSKDWLYNKFCWTGCGAPKDIEIIREMYSIHGDPSNEIERFLNPKTYYARNGGAYLNNEDGSATIMYKVSAQPRKLLTDWTIEKAEDVEAFHHPDLENKLIDSLTCEVSMGDSSILSNPDSPEDDF